MSSAAELNKKFGIAGAVSFEEDANHYVLVKVEGKLATATLAMQGAQVIHYQPHGAEPVIWLSPDAKLAAGKSIRGGVPVCWPWFGPHHSDAKLPAHGYARTVPWRLNQVHRLPGGEIRLEFELVTSAQTRKMWPHDCVVRNIITVGKSLRHELVTSNNGKEAVTVSQALHTYFHIGDVRKTRIIGLAGCDYLDKVSGMARKTQLGPVTIGQEVDRIYLNTPATCEIVDEALKRRIIVRCEGSRSTVVWNPWAVKARQMGDLGPDGHLKMLCVETANAADDAVTISAGGQHRMVATYSSVAL